MDREKEKEKEARMEEAKNEGANGRGKISFSKRMPDPSYV